MSEDRTDIVRRVLDSLAEEGGGRSLVDAYFETDREVMIAAARETLAATRDETDDTKIARRIEQELLDGLRLTDPPAGPGKLLSRLYMRRGAVTAGVTLLAILASILMILL